MNENDVLFELSWEVCNKCGGIHTVITSKAKTIKKHYKNYFLIGPYFKNKDYEKENEFIPQPLPQNFNQVEKQLLEQGIKIHYGTYNISGSPNVILIEYLDYSTHTNEIKKTLWEKYKIDSLNSNWYDYDEVMLWSWCCGIVIQHIANTIYKHVQNVLIHSHEWLSGIAILYLKTLPQPNQYKTTFTTHATMLGRTICGIGENVYEIQDKINPDKKAYELNVHTKHQTEKVLANISDCFTTVSQITGEEAKNFYKKNPDTLLYNGFENSNYKLIENIQTLSKKSKQKTNELFTKYFNDYYKLDLNQTQIFYTSGRNEFRNKGVDIYIKALNLLNQKLKKEHSPKTVVNLFLIPIGNFQKDPRLNENHTMQTKNELEQPPLSTHFIPQNNEIISTFIKENLLNKKEDNVKVILIPIYINRNDNLFNQSYYETIIGFDLGVFPSFYEPWGYTPLESISFKVPTITSDLSGFGRAILRDFEKGQGVEIIKRYNTSQEESIKSLSDYLYDFTQKTDEKLEEEKQKAIDFSQNFTWEIFIYNYLKAYEIACKKVNCKQS